MNPLAARHLNGAPPVPETETPTSRMLDAVIAETRRTTESIAWEERDIAATEERLANLWERYTDERDGGVR